MNWYIQQVLCIRCHTPAKIRQFQSNGKGEIKLVGSCSTCGVESAFITEPETLCLWAKHKDNPFPSEEDKEFLHDLCVSWEVKQLPPPN